MSSENHLVRTDHSGGIVEIGLNRAPVNALSPDMLMDFADLLDRFAKDTTVKAVVLSSSFKVFSAGLDLKEAQNFDRSDQDAVVKGLNMAFLKLFEFPKPTVAAVTGSAIAGGLFFVLASDFRISSAEAKFGLAEIRVGVHLPVGPMEIARATLNANDLRRLMLGGQPITAQAAVMAGFVDVIAPDDDILARAIMVAGELADHPPQAFATVKQQIRGDVIDRIKAEIAAGANTPKGGWFTSETKPAMQRMIGS